MPEDVDPWRELLERAADDYQEVLGILRELPDADPEVLPSALDLVSPGVIGQVIVRGPQEVASQLLEPLVPLYARALEAADRSSPLGRLGVLTTAGVLAATGHAVDPDQALGRLLDGLLGRLGDLTDEERTGLGLACAALGFDDEVPRIIDGPADPFVPGQETGPSAQSYARYLVAAAAADAGTDDFSAAWASLVGYFPLRLETGGLGWQDLLWAGYGAYTRVFGYEPGEVAQEIHEYVHEFAEP